MGHIHKLSGNYVFYVIFSMYTHKNSDASPALSLLIPHHERLSPRYRSPLQSARPVGQGVSSVSTAGAPRSIATGRARVGNHASAGLPRARGEGGARGVRCEGARRSRRRVREASARSTGPHGRRGRQRRWWGSRDQGVPKLVAVSFNSAYVTSYTIFPSLEILWELLTSWSSCCPRNACAGPSRSRSLSVSSTLSR